MFKRAKDVLIPTATLAYSNDGEFHCGEWCRFYKAKADCRERAEANLQIAKDDFTLPPLLTDDEFEEILGKLDEFSSWANDMKIYTLQAAISGKE